MKPIPPFPPKTFHRIRPGNPRALNDAIAKRTTDIVSTDLASEFKLGDGLVVASWDGSGLAKVEALGIVVEINASKEREVEWIRVEFELPGSDRPRGGSQFWTQQKPTFKFDNGVAEEFRLKQFFTKYPTDPFAASRGETA